MPQLHPTMGPKRFLARVPFLAVRPSEVPIGILRQFCSCGHIRLRAPYGLTWLYTYGSIELFTGLHMDPVQCRCGHRTGPAWESPMFFIFYGSRMGPVQEPQGCRMAPLRTREGIDTTRICKKKRTGVVCDRTGPVYAPYMGCLWSLNPYGACKLMMHAFKLFGPCTGRQNSYGAAPVTGCTIFVQNSPGTARTGPGSVMWLGHQFKSGNNLLPYGAKPLSEPMMTYPQWGLHTRLNEISSAGKWSA